mmetsp:Transcript_19686/g.36223  ORF Transcript_19686/g.36223 Transcript_19686/m.36223 type:complete len:116 (+) Transcript_19686:2429-2776(+)
MVKEAKPLEPKTLDYTIHLHKRVHKVAFKKRAPRAIDEIRNFAQRIMKTKDVRIDRHLNDFVWSQGIRHVPNRVRVRLSRKRNEDEAAGEQFYTLVQYVDVDSFEGLKPERVVAQ